MRTDYDLVTETLIDAAVAMRTASDYLRSKLPLPEGEMKRLREVIRDAREALEKADTALNDEK